MIEIAKCALFVTKPSTTSNLKQNLPTHCHCGKEFRRVLPKNFSAKNAGEDSRDSITLPDIRKSNIPNAIKTSKDPIHVENKRIALGNSRKASSRLMRKLTFVTEKHVFNNLTSIMLESISIL